MYGQPSYLLVYSFTYSYKKIVLKQIKWDLVVIGIRK